MADHPVSPRTAPDRTTSSLSSERVRVGVIGGGAWGTALALHSARMGHDTLIWALEKEVADAINTQHENTTYLKGYPLPESLRASNDLAEVAGYGELVLFVIPTPFVERTVGQIADTLRDDQIVVSCTKGILNGTLETPHDILKRVLPPRLHARLAYLSGPSFAAEVAKNNPTAVTIASESDAVAQRAQVLLSTTRFRCYRTHDVVGVELGGALKNVLAIACGISDGLGFGRYQAKAQHAALHTSLGSNGRAALITRGLDEITRLVVACGGSPLTMAGLSGIGDIVLTCTGDLSRNRTVGLRIGKGEKLADITASMTAVAEGILTSRAAHDLAAKKGIDCPTIEGIYRIVTENMSRPLKAEVNPLVAEAAHNVEVHT
eukprot:scaffold15.g4238.t1